jgi:glycerol transport system ATP-binding protein
MATIELVNIKHTYVKGKTQTHALRGINLKFEVGSPSALLGPSGCGKTTLLNILSGLLIPTSGRVYFDGKDVTNLPTEERNIAQVFQFPVVYDSMDVYGNLAFPLRNRKVPQKEVDERVREIADLLDLSDVLAFHPRSLGASQRQLLALGRCLVRKDTSVILLDEPMTQIDVHQRWYLRRELSKVQSSMSFTMIYVTHDQYEALTFAEKVMVMKDGLVVQEGTPEELYQNPASPFVGYFIGTPGMNVLECDLEGNSLMFKGFSKRISNDLRDRVRRHGTRFTIGIRPEFVHCDTTERKDWFQLSVAVIEDRGEFQILTLASNGVSVKSQVPSSLRVSEGERVWVNFLEEKVKFYKDDALIA